MTYKQFLARATAAKLTLRQLRCDVPPTPAVFELLEEVGPAAYERFVTRMCAEAKAFDALIDCDHPGRTF